MGLDMYLNKKTYVKNWSHMSPEELHEVIVKKNGEVRTDIKPERISHIEESVGTWRKFNALHSWFVNNVQNGVDDCGTYYVDESKLEELVEILTNIDQSLMSELKESNQEWKFEVDGYRNEDNYGMLKLDSTTIPKTIELCDESLPTQGGFFFGGTDYDYWYFQEMKQTIETLNGLVEEGGDFYYRASW